MSGEENCSGTVQENQQGEVRQSRAREDAEPIRSILDAGVESAITDTMIRLLIEQALRDEKLIGLMAEAVRHNSKDRVFELAKELTNGKQ